MKRKLISISITNIGKIDSFILNKTEIRPLNAIFGDSEAGKSTILNAFKCCLGGTYSTDIIKHGKDRGEIKIVFEGGECTATFKRKENGESIRDIKLIMDNKVINKPVDYLKGFINPFTLEPDLLLKKKGVELKRFILDICKIDTSAIEEEIEKLSTLQSTEKAKILSLPVPVVVEKPNLEAAKFELDTEVEKWKKLKAEFKEKQDAENLEIELKNAKLKTEFEGKQAKINTDFDNLKTSLLNEISVHNKEIDETKEKNAKIRAQVDSLYFLVNEMVNSGFDSIISENYIKSLNKWFDSSYFVCPIPEKRDFATEFSKIEKEVVLQPEYSKLNTEEFKADYTKYYELKNKVENIEKYELPAYEKHLAEKKRYDDNEAQKTKVEQIGKEVRAKRLELLEKLSEVSKVLPSVQVNSNNGELLISGTQFDAISDGQKERFKLEVSKLFDSGINVEIIDRCGELGLKVDKTMEYLLNQAEVKNNISFASFLRDVPENLRNEKATVFFIENGVVKIVKSE